MATEHDPQRITRLTALVDVLARIDAMVKPVALREVDVGAAVGRVNAAQWQVRPRPSTPVAIRDGWAVQSELSADASSYAPVPLSAALRIDAGEPLPDGFDAVAPTEVVVDRDGRIDIIASVVAGDGVLPIGADADWRDNLSVPGKALRPLDVAVLMAAGVKRTQIRMPRIRVVNTRGDRDTILHAARTLIAGAVARDGSEALCDDGNLADAFARDDADAIVALGGTGSGRNDASVRTLAQAGHVEVHGVALSPGETVAFGFVGARPVLLLPGRLDAALAGWVTLGRHLLARLSGRMEEPPGATVVLARKVASPLGFAEIVLVRCRDRKAEPIASGYWPLSAIARSDGWIMVPADSEGYPAGAVVVLRPWA